jgi:hypothetical protein
VTNDSDEFYRACIVVLPRAGVFNCHRERRSLLTGVLNSHVPMDINWLRLRHDSPRTALEMDLTFRDLQMRRSVPFGSGVFAVQPQICCHSPKQSWG